MKIKTAIRALLLATAQVQAFTLLNSEWPGNGEVEVGVPITLQWSGNQGLVTIKLFGDSYNIGDVPILVVAEGLEGQSYTWTPPTSLEADMYGLHLNDAMSTLVYLINVSKPPAATSSGSSPVQTAPATTSTGTESGRDTAPTFAASTTSTAGPAETTGPSGSDSSTAPADSSSNGLPTAAVAAIATLSSVIGLALLGLVAYCAVVQRRKRRNGEKGGAAGEGSDDVPSDAVEIYTESTDTPGMKAGEMHGEGRAELPTGVLWDRAAELSAEERHLK